MTPEIEIEVRFLLESEGGRKNPVTGDPYPYGCPMIIDGKAHDCRLLIGNKILELGKPYEVPVKFLNKDLALPKLFIGKSVVLWEGKNIATAKVIKIN